MVLSNSEIIKAMREGSIVIDPAPDAASAENPFDTTSLNLRLGKIISIPKEGVNFIFDLRNPGITSLLKEQYISKSIDEIGGFNLPPGKFALANTLEKIHLPILQENPCYAARVEGRSSFARCGLMVHFTAPTIHAGFNGTITLELINFGPTAIALFPGMYICQLIFEKVAGEILFTPSQFQGQTTPEGH